MPEDDLRTAAIALRVVPDLKSAVESAAKDDRRSVAAFVELALIEKLERLGKWPRKKK